MAPTRDCPRCEESARPGHRPCATQEAPKAEAAKKDEAKGEPAKKEEAAKKEPEKYVEAPPPTVPKEVEEKLEKARRAVAEAIVAAEDAGLVDSSIDPPPILDILIKGYAIDAPRSRTPVPRKRSGPSPPRSSAAGLPVTTSRSKA